MNDLLTPVEACAHLKIKSPVTLRRWVKAGRLQAVRFTGVTIRYRRSDLDALTVASLHTEAPVTPKSPEPRPIDSARPRRLMEIGDINPITGLPYGQYGGQNR